MTALSMGLAFGSLWALGAFALSLARVRDQGSATVLVTDFAAGAVMIAFAGTVTIVLGLHLSLVLFYLLLAGLAAGALRWGRWEAVSLEPVRDRLASGLLGLTGITLLAVGAAALSDRLWWDGWAIWALKGRVLFLEGTLPRAFLDPGGPYGFSHLDYPLLVSLIDWWGFRHVGSTAPAVASFTGFVWFSMIPLLLWGALRRRLGERLAALAALAAAACWPIAFFATGGTADVVIALALLGAAIELERAMGHGGRAALWRAGIFLGLAATSKNEGLALALVGLGVGILARGNVARPHRLPALLLPVAVAAPWFLFTRAMGFESDVLASSPGVWEAGARAWVLAGALVRHFASTPWQPLPVLAGLGLIAALRRPDPGLSAGWALVTGYFAVLCGVYISAPLDLNWLIATSVPRVFSVFGPATLFLVLVSVVGRPGEPTVR